jgi:phosphoribosylformylglycinamidine cyclo-ligase
VIKDNLFDIPPLFDVIQTESRTSWQEMYKVFNMGHRMEIYCDEQYAQEMIDISKNFGVEAQIVGRVEPINSGTKLTINSKYGEFIY